MLLPGASAQDGIAREQLRSRPRGRSLRQPAVGVVVDGLDKLRIIVDVQRHPRIQPRRRHGREVFLGKDVLVLVAKVRAVIQKAVFIGQMILADAALIGFAGHQAHHAPLPVSAHRVTGIHDRSVGVVRPEERFIRVQKQTGHGRILPERGGIANNQRPRAVVLFRHAKRLIGAIRHHGSRRISALIGQRDGVGRQSRLKQRGHISRKGFLRKRQPRKQRQNHGQQRQTDDFSRFFHTMIPP